MTVDEYGLVNLDQMCDWIEAKSKLLIGSVSDGYGMQPGIKHMSNTIFQWIDGNKIPSGYIIGIDNPLIVTHILWIKLM